MPDFYKTTLKKFQELDVLKKTLSKPCPNYTNPGSIKPKGEGLFCNDVNNPVVSLFGSRNSSNIFWKVEKSRYCFDKKNGCGKCRDTCSNNIQTYPNCNITDPAGDLETYGEHYSFCFDCCFKSCTCALCDCMKYQNECVRGQLKCVRIHQYQILLKPVFPSSGNFKCHVEMSRGPEVVIETTLWRFGKRVYSVNSNDHNLTKENNENTRHDFGYIIVSHPTAVLQSMMGNQILVSGNTHDNEFEVGTYQHEADVTNTIATGPKSNEIHVQPRIPFGISSKTWNKRDCDADINQTSGGFAVVQDKKSHQNFQRLPNLTAILDRQDSVNVYKVYDNKQSHRINFGMPRNRSVLRHMFPKTAIVNDDSLVGVLLRNRTFWTLRYTGRLMECPGAFNLRLYDQDIPSVEVYNYDIGENNII